jgi:hypothetical protein
LDDLRERCGTNADSCIYCRKQACGTALRELLAVQQAGLRFVIAESVACISLGSDALY